MLIHPLPCVDQFVEALNESLQSLHPTAKLTWSQRSWLSTVLMGIVVTQTLCWAAFERRSQARFKQSRLRWVFYQAKIAWSLLLRASVRRLLEHYSIKTGVLVLDDTDKRRAKVTTRIAATHKIKDKKSGGYFNGQELVFLVLVTDLVTVPVDFRFYTPDPALSAWRKRYREQKRQGLPAKHRARRPEPNRQYPQKTELALDMLKTFTQAFPEVTIRGVLADALYGNATFIDQAAAATRGAQVISELRTNQLVMVRGKAVSLTHYFARQPGVETLLTLRGQAPRPVVMLAARLLVKAHQKKRFVIALRYADEQAYRFLVASDLSWRHEDVARLHSLRWLIEVFIEDWKCYGGWNRLTKQQGADGATRGVILSLLCDHLLLLHPDQSRRFKNQQPGLPAGCVIEQLKVEALMGVIKEIITADNPMTALEALTRTLRDTLPERSSRKHMVGLDLGRQEPTPSLRYRAAA